MSVSKTPPVCHQLCGGVETWNYDFRGDLVWKFQSLAKFPTVFPYQDLEVQLKHSVSDGWNPALASFQRLKLSTNGAVGIRATSGLETQSFFRKKNIKERERERPSKNWSIHLPPQQKKNAFLGGRSSAQMSPSGIVVNPLFRSGFLCAHPLCQYVASSEFQKLWCGDMPSTPGEETICFQNWHHEMLSSLQVKENPGCCAISMFGRRVWF